MFLVEAERATTNAVEALHTINLKHLWYDNAEAHNAVVEALLWLEEGRGFREGEAKVTPERSKLQGYINELFTTLIGEAASVIICEYCKLPMSRPWLLAVANTEGKHNGTWRYTCPNCYEQVSDEDVVQALLHRKEVLAREEITHEHRGFGTEQFIIDGAAHRARTDFGSRNDFPSEG